MLIDDVKKMRTTLLVSRVMRGTKTTSKLSCDNNNNNNNNNRKIRCGFAMTIQKKKEEEKETASSR